MRTNSSTGNACYADKVEDASSKEFLVLIKGMLPRLEKCHATYKSIDWSTESNEHPRKYHEINKLTHLSINIRENLTVELNSSLINGKFTIGIAQGIYT